MAGRSQRSRYRMDQFLICFNPVCQDVKQFCYNSCLALRVGIAWMDRHSWGDASRPRASLLSYSLDKLFTTIQTILVSFTSAFCVFLFSTLFDGDVFIHDLATHRAEAHRSVSAPVIEVGAIVCPRYHLFFLSVQDYLD